MTYDLFIHRSTALRSLKRRLGHAVVNLNTAVVGLEAVKIGVATKPKTLSVNWDPKDLPTAAREARRQIASSLLVSCVDAIDRYLRNIGTSPSLLQDMAIEQALAGIPQTTKAAISLTAKARADFLSGIANAISDDALWEVVGVFKKTYGEERKSLGVRRRLARLVDAYPLPPHYHAALDLLVSWRNRHVHESGEELSDGQRSALLFGHYAFCEFHSGTSISTTLEHYDERRGPSLKDISTLISVLIWSLSRLDALILSSADLESYALDCLKMEWAKLGKKPEQLKHLWGLGKEGRARKIASLIETGGFSRRPAQKSTERSLPASFLADLANMDREGFDVLVTGS